MNEPGVIIIGRNEGERLRRCLESVAGRDAAVVYVDSGSSDHSCVLARELGAHVVELDMGISFTAARARNAGRTRLAALGHDVAYLQFVDGDCEIEPGWIEAAVAHLEEAGDVAAVCGHLRERHPDASIYNRLCALEWRSSAGSVRNTGGIFMVRAGAFDQVDGFRESMIAGEEPELCQRLRAQGWTLQRIDVPMAVHDAAMTRFGQWWKRAVRSGHAYAEGAHLHRQGPERPWRREVRRHWFWGLILPLLALGLAWPTYGASLMLFAAYPIWIWKIARARRRDHGDATDESWLYAFFCMLAALPSALGQMLFWWRRLIRRPSTLIEYKTDVGGREESGKQETPDSPS